PRASGVLAALGLVVSERRRDVQRSVLISGDLTATAEEADRLADRARAELGGDSEVRLVAELRYKGQAFELSVELTDDLGRAFHEPHEQAYGYRDAEAEVELVPLRATATEPGPQIDPDASGGEARRSRRETVYGDTEIIRGEPAPGETIQGPAVVELPE